MGRILAIDYGRKRCGIAVSDPLRLIAGGLTTIETHKILDFLKDYCAKEEVDIFVIGEAKQMDNSPSESMKFINPFKQLLAKTFPDKPIHSIDERFTSKMAFQSMIDGGLKKKQRQNKALIDQVSATIILQSYMNQTPHNE